MISEFGYVYRSRLKGNTLPLVLSVAGEPRPTKPLTAKIASRFRTSTVDNRNPVSCLELGEENEA